ncbi:MAG TPA: hypothetical protein VHZ74_10785 [Bryobacteraceae bacterium]|nr:hypothetical protein [Bryobacteraceae bacterium]
MADEGNSDLLMGATTILELPPDVQLPESAASELNMRFLWIGQQLKQFAAELSSEENQTVVGTRNERLNIIAFDANNFKGLQFVETDTSLIYLSQPLQSGSAGYVWKYMSGIVRTVYSSPLASAPTLGKALGALDANLLVYLTDKNRTMRWTGSAFEFAPWEVIPAGMVLGFRADPGTGWRLCDGSAGIAQLNADGTTTSITVEDFTSAGNKAAYPKWGAAADGFQAAIAPLITGDTADATTGITVSAAGAATAASVATTHGAATGTDFNAVVTINGGGGGGGGGVVTDPGHHHAHGTLVNDALGEPRHYDLIPYQRV